MEFDIVLEIIDHTYVKVITQDELIFDMLYERYSFRPDGYQFMALYKQKRWDGYVRLLNRQNGLIYLGLYTDIVKFCNERGYTTGVISHIQLPEVIPKPTVEKYINGLNISCKGEKITPYDYQIQTVLSAIESNRELIISPTSSGKSLIQYLIIRYYEIVLKGKALMIVPTKGLVTQMYDDFGDYSALDTEWDVDERCYCIKPTKSKDVDNPIIITTWQSIQRQPDSWFQQFDKVFVDEVHTFSSDKTSSIMLKCDKTPVKLGLTGTLDECQMHMYQLIGMFGPIRQFVTTKELMDRGIVTPLHITCLKLKYKTATCKAFKNSGEGKSKRPSYAEEINWLCNSEERNNYIADKATNLDGNTIVMFKLKEHGKKLYELIKQQTNKKVYFIDGSVSGDEREMIRKAMEEDGCILVGSLGTISTGISIKNIKHIIFANPTKSRVKVLQSIGRLLRLHKNKSCAYLYDIIDDLRYLKTTNYTLEHGVIRINYYNNQEFDYIIHDVEEFA